MDLQFTLQRYALQLKNQLAAPHQMSRFLVDNRKGNPG